MINCKFDELQDVDCADGDLRIGNSYIFRITLGFAFP